MKKYIKPAIEVENITVDSSIMSISDQKGVYSGQTLKSKLFDLDEELEEEEW